MAIRTSNNNNQSAMFDEETPPSPNPIRKKHIAINATSKSISHRIQNKIIY